MPRPLISCLLVTYNQEDFVAEALQSILAQSYTPLEIVVSDDASPDRTYEVLQREVAAYDGPHRVILRRNAVRANIVGHLAAAVPFTNGEFIVMAAGDDISLPNRVECIAAAWEASGRQVHALNSSVQQFDEHGLRGGALAGCGERAQLVLEDFVDRSAAFLGASGAYSRAVFERFGPLDPANIFEDQVLPFRAALLGRTISLPEVLVLWRRMMQSSSAQYLYGPAQTRARLARLLYQQQQQASYQRQRLVDIDFFLQQGGQSAAALPAMQSKLRRIVATAQTAARALQRPVPSLALLGQALRGTLSFKQALRLFALYRAPQVTNWWFTLRNFRR